MPNWEAVKTLRESAAETASGVGPSIDLGARDRLLRQVLTVTAAAGTLVVRLEASADGASGWRSFATFAPLTTTGSERCTFIAPERYVRVGWTITGGVGHTFGIDGHKGVVFANLEQLEQFGMAKGALASLSPTTKAEELAGTTELASGILAVRYDPPIVTKSLDLAKAVCKIAVYELLSVRGLNPDGDDSNIRTRYEDAMKWLEKVASGAITPVDLIDTSPDEDGWGVEMVTHAPRPWRC